MTMSEGSHFETDQLAASLRETGTFLYANSHKLVLVSIGWFVSSLLIVTIGPATLAAYVAIDQLDSDENRIDWNALVAAVRARFVPAVLFGIVPPLFYGISALYLVAQSDDPSTVRAGLFFVTLYLALYATLMMIPTFRGLAVGLPAKAALLGGIRWTAAHPTLAMLAGLVTLIVMVVTLLLTVGFVLLFPAIAFSFHMKLVDLDDDSVTEG